MKDSDFIFDCVHLANYKCHKIIFKQSGSYVDSPNWRENKKARINLISKKELILSIRSNSCAKS